MISALVLLAAPSSLSAILRSPDLKGAMVGVVVAAPDGKVLFSEGADLRLMPASNQKLFTVAFALDTLGSKYRSATRFWRDEDSITIDSDGTLDVSYARLKAFADRFGRRPNVALSQSFVAGRPESWQLGDVPNRYAPSIAAFTCERGGVELWTDAEGEPELLPAPLGLVVAPPGETAGFTETRPIAGGLRYDTVGGVLYRPSGPITKRGPVDTLSQPKPDLAAAGLFASEAEGSRIVRSMLDPALVRRRKPDAVLLTDPLGDVAGRCLKPSDNYLAEHLLMMGAARRLDRRVDYGNAPEAVASWARGRVAISGTAFDPADGSGLSRKNLVTARSVARLLNWSKKQSWGGVYTAALAKPGEGTLKGRLAGVRFRGKTGTLTGACSLAGLVRSRSGRELAVSLLMNHYPCSTARARAIQDEFVKRVAASL